MTDTPTIWFCTAFLPVYRCGGWAFVRRHHGETVGFAGGVRQTTATRLALIGLAAALDGGAVTGAAGAAPVAADLVTAIPDLVGYADVLAGLAGRALSDLPDLDRDLWSAVSTASAGRNVRLSPRSRPPSAPLAFVAAWAELASGKVKAAGPFKAAIPKANLSKVAFPS